MADQSKSKDLDIWIDFFALISWGKGTFYVLCLNGYFSLYVWTKLLMEPSKIEHIFRKVLWISAYENLSICDHLTWLNNLENQLFAMFCGLYSI